MSAVSFWGDGLYPVIIVLAVAWAVKRHDKLLAVIILLATFFAHLTKEVAKSSFRTDRPFEYGCDVLTRFADGYAFPSGHVTHYVVFFGLLIFFARKNKNSVWAPWLAVFSYLNIILISFSRIYLGAHWPADVIGGYILGGVFLYLSIESYKFLVKRGWGRIRVYDKKGNIQKAGAIVVREVKNKKEVLLLFRKKQNDFTFPKGSLDLGETPREAAVREVLEETGFSVKLKKRLPSIYYDYPEGDGRVCVHMFLAEVLSEAKKTEKDEFPLWVPLARVEKKLTHDNLRSYWQKINEANF